MGKTQESLYSTRNVKTHSDSSYKFGHRRKWRTCFSSVSCKDDHVVLNVELPVVSCFSEVRGNVPVFKGTFADNLFGVPVHRNRYI